jgi:hypothetical protein
MLHASGNAKSPPDGGVPRESFAYPFPVHMFVI